MKASILLLPFLVSLSSCSLVKRDDVGLIVRAKDWKERADKFAASHPAGTPAYTSTRKSVNDLLDGKSTEAKLKAHDYVPISQVSVAKTDIVPPNLDATVDTTLGAPSAAPKDAGAGAVAAAILEQLRKMAVEGRVKEAEYLEKELGALRWKQLP